MVWSSVRLLIVEYVAHGGLLMCDFCPVSFETSVEELVIRLSPQPGCWLQGRDVEALSGVG